ncbi:MAG TPA: hypothetical protein ENJ48_01730 [Anaerolineae bacterium]|nr:hypothetical protein [Anaerolineae bacterium]
MGDSVRVTLLGAPTCRRYKTMRQRVLQVAESDGIPLELREENDTAALSAINPLHLPMLQVENETIATGNPPSLAALRHHLRQHTESLSERDKRFSPQMNADGRRFSQKK